MGMSPATIGIVVGGLLPAVIYGITGVFAKASTKAGIGIGPYLIIIGFSIAAVGLGFFLHDGNKTLSTESALHAIGMGATWGLATGFIAIGLTTYAVPLSKLVPLYNMNTLVAVLLALIIFAEWQQVKIVPLLVGAVLIMIGGILVARA